MIEPIIVLSAIGIIWLLTVCKKTKKYPHVSREESEKLMEKNK
jgi:uncharacterized ion transporter superfamily protein YfcC